MLLLRMENGRTEVKFVKDWSPAWIGRGYLPPLPAPTRTHDYYVIQRALLTNRRTYVQSRRCR